MQRYNHPYLQNFINTQAFVTNSSSEITEIELGLKQFI